jgi:hypothetical protein
VTTLARLLRETRGTQIVEFAVTLPLLVVFLIVIYDFANAFSVKHKLVAAVREGTRFAANQPTADLSNPSAGSCSPGDPICTGSVEAIARLVGNQLLAEGLPDCGLTNTAVQTVTNSGLTWTYEVDSGCPGSLTVTVNRGYTYLVGPSALYVKSMTVDATQMTISYPYQWQFYKVIWLIAPDSKYARVSQITASATIPNLN